MDASSARSSEGPAELRCLGGDQQPAATIRRTFRTSVSPSPRRASPCSHGPPARRVESSVHAGCASIRLALTTPGGTDHHQPRAKPRARLKNGGRPLLSASRSRNARARDRSDSAIPTQEIERLRHGCPWKFPPGTTVGIGKLSGLSVTLSPRSDRLARSRARRASAQHLRRAPEWRVLHAAAARGGIEDPASLEESANRRRRIALAPVGRSACTRGIEGRAEPQSPRSSAHAACAARMTRALEGRQHAKPSRLRAG
jgi:hypothetical protein